MHVSLGVDFRTPRLVATLDFHHLFWCHLHQPEVARVAVQLFDLASFDTAAMPEASHHWLPIIGLENHSHCLKELVQKS
jgi:hypothetical protein